MLSMTILAACSMKLIFNFQKLVFYVYCHRIVLRVLNTFFKTTHSQAIRKCQLQWFFNMFTFNALCFSTKFIVFYLSIHWLCAIHQHAISIIRTFITILSAFVITFTLLHFLSTTDFRCSIYQYRKYTQQMLSLSILQTR